MELKKISFCDTTCYNVCSNSFKDKLLKQIQTDHEIDLSEKSIRIYDEKRHSKILYQNQYIMSIKSIGNTYFIYLTKIEGVNSCFLIDKKILKGYSYPRIILVKFRFVDYLFNDTLLEGDLIKTKSGWKILVGDIIIHKGEIIKQKNFNYRINILSRIFDKHYIKDTYLEPCSIFIKKYFPYNKVGQSELLKMLEEIDYKSQGICFTSERDYKPSFLVFLQSREKTEVPINDRPGIINKRQPPLSKSYIGSDQNNSTDNDSSVVIDVSNSSSKNTSVKYFNFKISKTTTPGIYQLYCIKVGKIIKHSIARIEGLVCLKFVQDVLEGSDSQPIVQCEYNIRFKKFIPRQLSEKSTPDEYTDIIYHTHEKM